MKRIAKFEKVSFEQFYSDYCEAMSATPPKAEVLKIYEKIELPKRATKGSAGFDFFAPYDLRISPKSRKIPSGIRAWMEDGWVLQCYPRSGLGFKHRMKLNNTVGIVDADYYNSDNQGHLIFKVYAAEEFTLAAGTGFAQGIFMEFGVTVDDDVTEERNGGFGSTTKKESTEPYPDYSRICENEM